MDPWLPDFSLRKALRVACGSLCVTSVGTLARDNEVDRGALEIRRALFWIPDDSAKRHTENEVPVNPVLSYGWRISRVSETISFRTVGIRDG